MPVSRLLLKRRPSTVDTRVLESDTVHDSVSWPCAGRFISTQFASRSAAYKKMNSVHALIHSSSSGLSMASWEALKVKLPIRDHPRPPRSWRLPHLLASNPGPLCPMRPRQKAPSLSPAAVQRGCGSADTARGFNELYSLVVDENTQSKLLKNLLFPVVG